MAHCLASGQCKKELKIVDQTHPVLVRAVLQREKKVLISNALSQINFPRLVSRCDEFHIALGKISDDKRVL